MRAARREELLALGLRDRRFGWPLEMVLRAADAGWRIEEVPVSYRPARGPLEGDRHRSAGRLRTIGDMTQGDAMSAASTRRRLADRDRQGAACRAARRRG